MNRSAYEPLLALLREREAWVALYAGVVSAGANLLGKAHVPWATVGICFATSAAFFLFRKSAVNLYRRYRLRKINRRPIDLEIVANGLRLYHPDRTIRILHWPKIREVRVGDSVLILYLPEKSWRGRRRFLVLPLDGVPNATRVSMLGMIPDRLRSKSVIEAQAKWRLS